MTRRPAVCTAALTLILLPGSNRIADRGSAVEQHQPDPTFVVFEVRPLKSGDGAQQWMATYNSEGKTAKFRIDLGPSEVVPAMTAGELAVKSGEGTLLPESGSDSSALLGHLQNVLRGKAVPTAVTRTSVPFTYIDLGEKPPQAQDSAVGHWTALKLIFGEGERESQVLLHINSVARKGQFAMKDPVYGDLATAELAKVL